MPFFQLFPYFIAIVCEQTFIDRICETCFKSMTSFVCVWNGQTFENFLLAFNTVNCIKMEFKANCLSIKIDDFYLILSFCWISQKIAYLINDIDVIKKNFMNWQLNIFRKRRTPCSCKPIKCVFCCIWFQHETDPNNDDNDETRHEIQYKSSAFFEFKLKGFFNWKY